MTDNTLRRATSPFLEETPIVAVLRARQASQFAPVVETLLSAGIRSIELTLTTEGVFDQLSEVLREVGEDGEVGVGTVTTLAEAERALDGGAHYVVTPTLNLEVIAAATTRAIPVYPGALTPTEVSTAWNAGATAVKIFPASAVGPGYLGQLRGPFPDLSVIPSGGIDAANAAAWIKSGAIAVSVGGPLIGDAFEDGDLAELRARATTLRRGVLDAVADRGGRR
jgi:2-dehydro-3-deoxyphosphogluconate aldolase/(4S)-4-hydroxy-2-oxoglutarate aldolase